MPNPVKRDLSLVWMLLGVVLLGGALVFSGVYIFARYMASQVSVNIRDLRNGGKSVDIESPQGSLRVKGEVSEGQLGMPLYPGSRRRKNIGATLGVEVPSIGNFQVAAAEFETDDALDKVAAFYRKGLGPDAQERKFHDKLEFLLLRGEGRRKMIVLRPARRGEGTQISMAQVTEAETN